MLWIERAKQLQALFAGALPLIAAKVQFLLPFLNPKIVEELWPIIGLLAIVSSGVHLQSCKRFPVTSLREEFSYGGAFLCRYFDLPLDRPRR
jgi:hypothetical protein